MAYLGDPPQSYWPTPFVSDPAFDPELTDPSTALHDNHTQTPSHSISHGMPPTTGDPSNAAAHILDPALSDDLPSHQGQHQIIFHQTSPHSYAPPPPFADQTAAAAAAASALPPPDQIFPGGRMRAGSKDMQSHPHNGEVMMDDGHGGAYIAPSQNPFVGNGVHSDVHQPIGQPAQIKFRATTNTASTSGGGGRRPKMTKEEQMARRRLRTDTDEYRTQERERMRRRRAREKEERDRLKREQEEQLRAQGKESWIAPPAATPKRKTVKMVKKKTPTSSNPAGDEAATAEEDASRDSKRQSKVDNRAATQESTDEGDPMETSEDLIDIGDDTKDEDEIEDELYEKDGEDKEGEDGVDGTEKGGEGAGLPSDDKAEGENGEKKEIRASARRSAVGKPASPVAARPTRATAKSSPVAKSASAGSTPSRSIRSTRQGGGEPEKQEIATTRSGRTTRSALSTPAKRDDKRDDPATAPPISIPTGPIKMATRKQTVTTPASPSSPAISKTRVSLKSLTVSGGTPTTPVSAEAKSPGSARTDGKSGPPQPPVVMLFGYPAGVNPPCDVSSVSVTVESTKTNKICMMTADDMRRPPSPPIGDGDGEKMDVDAKPEEAAEIKTEEKSEPKDGEKDKEEMTIDPDIPLVPTEKNKENVKASSPSAQRKSTTPDGNANGRFSWDLVVQMLKADIGFDPARDELVGFHHKDPLLLSCDRHINTAMVMAAKEGVRMPKWYVYEKQQEV
ncbi:hypothetical protein ABW19_dt0205820 [Dactylella cylindrospora]|nr:hypothetical protein ABW19_dt0205820 [Dactylella cylindrospora]